jgi:hypothetical protein
MPLIPSEAPTTPLPRAVDPEAELKALRADVAPESPKDDADNPMGKEKWGFSVDFKGAKASFTNKILTIAERVEVGLLQARLARNAPWEALDEETRYLLNVIAHLTVSLAEKPMWFSPNTLKDTAILYAVYAEVAKHETYFRTGGATQASGA